jgi:hypothetical protein
MKLQYYIYEIRELLPDSKKSLDDREIIRLINLQRIFWIKNEINKNRPAYDNLVQTIHLELVLVDQSTYPGISTTSRILRTDLTIPKPILTATNDTILNIRNPLVIAEPFNYVTRDNSIYCGNGKTNTKDIYCWQYNSYLWIKINVMNPKIALLRNIAVEGIWEDPVLVDRDYILQESEMVYEPYDFEYPMNDALWAYIKEYIKKGSQEITTQNAEEEITR